jgi:hypothetical protein
MANQSKKIEVKDLTLWDENARFPDKYYNQEESELIEYFLSKSDFKIKTLIEAIVKDFDLPQLEKIIVWNDGEQNIVLEGNRRLTAYKLLINPSLVKEKKLKEFIEAEKAKIDISENYLLECILVEEREDAFRYIDRKHYNGNFEVAWKDTERAHYSKRRGSENPLELIKIGITKIVRDLDLPEEMKEQVLGQGYVTTFFRTITTKPAQKLYGYFFEDDEFKVKDKDFGDKLKVIIYSVLNKQDIKGNKIDSRTLNKKEDVEKFLESIEIDDTKVVEEKIKEKTTENIFGEKTITVGSTPSRQKVLPKSTNRNNLIPNSCRLTIQENKINNIYHELKEDLFLNGSKNITPNAVGILFRVFLEISIDYFLEREGINLPNETKLAGKITKCANELETKNLATKKQLVNIRKVATDKNHLLNIQNFHDYVHSYKTQPSSSDLILKWDNLQEFFQILWDYCYLNSKKK